MSPRPRLLLLLACILALEHRFGESICLEMKLKHFTNRYNTVQDRKPTCCDCAQLGDLKEREVKTLCLDNDRCDHDFRVEIHTFGTDDKYFSPWSDTEYPNNADFGDSIGDLTNKFELCQAVAKDGKPKPFMVLVFVDDQDDGLPDDHVAQFCAIIDLMKIGIYYRRISTWSMWKKFRYIANTEGTAPYHLIFEVRAVIEDRDPQEYKKNWGTWGWEGAKGSCSSRNTGLHNCRLLPTGGQAALRVSAAASAAAAAAAPSMLAIAALPALPAALALAARAFAA